MLYVIEWCRRECEGQVSAALLAADGDADDDKQHGRDGRHACFCLEAAVTLCRGCGRD